MTEIDMDDFEEWLRDTSRARCARCEYPINLWTELWLKQTSG